MDDKFARQQQAEQANAAAWCTAMNLAANTLGGSQQTQAAHIGLGSQQAIPEGLAYANLGRMAGARLGGQQDKGEIEMQMEALENQLKSLQIIASQISDKFIPILSGVNNNTGNLGSSPPLHTLLGSRLFTMNMQATQLRESLQDIIDRCKL